jgi:hypothetical protein
LISQYKGQVVTKEFKTGVCGLFRKSGITLVLAAILNGGVRVV